MFDARYASSPGIPATAPQNSGATTASEVFSATDSTTARAIWSASRPRGIAAAQVRQALPRRREVAGRSATAPIADASRRNEVPPSTVHVAAAVSTVPTTGRRPTRSAATPSAAAPDTSAAA